MNEEKVLCPSSRCEEGATLVGIVMPDGRIGFSAEQIKITAEFVEAAREGRAPEKRFRFAGNCIKAGCRQWTGSRCGVIDSVMTDAPPELSVEAEDLPECSIRAQCRWFGQAGAAACAVCEFVITDLRVDAEAA
jgi:hypothetical protein